MLHPVLHASIPHSICAEFQMLTHKIKNKTTYRRQDKSNSLYREGIEEICINNTFVARVVEPTSIDHLLNYRVLIETVLLLQVLPKKRLDTESYKEQLHIPCIETRNYFA
jgi:hypothetical protein